MGPRGGLAAILCECESVPLRPSRYLLGIDQALSATSTSTMSKTMSQVSLSVTSSIETLFAAALKEYKNQTKRDIASHSLVAQLQSCNSSSAILAILRAQVQKFDQTQSANEKWMKWVDPTVNVLYAFSATLGNGVGLVIAIKPLYIYPLTCMTTDIPTCECDFCWNWCSPPSKYLSSS